MKGVVHAVLAFTGIAAVAALLLLVRNCAERHEREAHRLECLQLNSNRTTADLIRICGEVER